MATVASIVTNLRANTGQFDKALDGAKRKLREVQTYTQQLQEREAAAANARRAAFDDERRQRRQAAQASQASSTLGALAQMETAANPVKIQAATKSFHELNNELKGILGRGSAFKDILEIAAGGGAIVGLNIAAQALGGMGRAMSDLAAASASGAANFDDFITKFVQSIPIIGGVHDAVKGVYDLLIGPDTSAAVAEKNKARRDGIAGFAAGSADQAFGAEQRLSMVGLSGAAAVRQRVKNENAAIERALDKSLGEMIDKFGGAVTATAEAYAMRAAANAEKRANTIAGNVEITKIQDEANAAIWKGIGKSITGQIETLEKFGSKISGAVGGGLGGLGAAVAARVQQDAERRQKEADRMAKEATARRSSFIGGARGIFERLKEQESGGALFGGAVVQGSQEDYAMRQRSIFGSNIARKDEKELAREAVELQKKEIDETKRTNDLLEELATNLSVVDFN